MMLALAGMITSVEGQEQWNEYRANHFIIYYKNVPQDFVKTVEQQAEYYYQEITDNLGFRRFTTWTFDERAKIYIYDDQDDYIKSARELHWSHGAANTKTKTIRTFPSAHGFFDSTLPHELGHIIFREFVGPLADIPLWFEEGVAMYQEKAKRWGARKAVQKAIAEGKFIPLKELSHTLLTSNTDKNLVNLYYAEAASVVYFMITELGQFRFVSLCRNLQSGQKFDNALQLTYIRFESIDDLNAAWLKNLKDNHGK